MDNADGWYLKKELHFSSNFLLLSQISVNRTRVEKVHAYVESLYCFLLLAMQTSFKSESRLLRFHNQSLFYRSSKK